MSVRLFCLNAPCQRYQTELFQDNLGYLNNVYIYKYEEHSIHSSYMMSHFEQTILLIFRLQVT